MNVIEEIESAPYVVVKDLDALLSQAEILREEDTLLRDLIRILRLEGRILVQETSDKKEILVRRMADEEEAEAFVRARLDLYERMWDGCGCRINYYQ